MPDLGVKSGGRRQGADLPQEFGEFGVGSEPFGRRREVPRWAEIMPGSHLSESGGKTAHAGQLFGIGRIETVGEADAPIALTPLLGAHGVAGHEQRG